MVIKRAVKRDGKTVYLKVIYTPAKSELRIKKTSEQKIYSNPEITPEIITIGGTRELVIFPIQAEYALLEERLDYEYSLFIRYGSKLDYLYLGDIDLELIANSYNEQFKTSNDDNEIKKVAEEMGVTTEIIIALKGKKCDIGNFVATVQNALKKYSNDTAKITVLERAAKDDNIACILLKNMGIHTAQSAHPSILAKYVLQKLKQK